MSYFDNANTTVTRKSFGSKVDKTFQREGVVPVKDRKKDEKDVVAESTKYNELNKKVENRRINDMVENRKYEIKLQEGYTKLKDELIKDFLSEICVESLLVDEKVVTANLKNIVSMVEEKVDTIGGFEGVKDIAESTQNPILLNMVSICEAVCKKVGERNLKESDKNAEKLNFSLNKDEMNDFDYRKKEMGTESIVNTIKDKVFQVVQDEQKLNTERQEVMTEIENKVQELNAPVQEAMDFIFNQNKIEETTLFDSLMRSHYKQLLETESSAIFESMDYQEEDEEVVFEEQEFSMSDVELEGCKKKKCGESCDECEDDDDDEYDDDECEDGECVEEAINQKKFQKKSRKMSDAKLKNKIVKWEKDIAATKARIKQDPADPDYKEDLKILNAELKVFKNELAHRNKQAKIKTNIYAKESVNNIFDDVFDEDTIDVDNLMESIDVFVAEINQDIESIKSKSEAIACKESVRQFQQDIEDVLTEGLGFKVLDAKIANFFNNLLSKKLAKRDYDKVRKNLTTMINDGNLTLTDIKALEADLSIAKQQLNRAKEQHPESKADIEKHIQWLDTTYKQMLANKKKELQGKAMKESMLPSVESVYSLMEARYRSALDNDNEVVTEACGKKAQEACGSKKTCEACGKKLDEACGDKKTCEACSKKVKEEIVVCPDCGKEKCICDEACGKKVKEACNKKKACKEALIAKLDECCETLNTIIESHELSYNNAIESLMLNMGDTNILVPYLQSKDCDMSNLEFVYKTKLVCETLKDSLKTIENNNDLSVLNKAVELNINSINETMEIIKDNESLSYKNHILNSGKQYLTKLHNIIESIEIPETELTTTMESSVFNSEEDVEKIFNMVKEYYVIESTNKDMMELVMAEAIVEYTIMEAFNTLNLVKYDKEIIRQMSRNNLNK